MPHGTPLISTLVGGFVLAFLLGAVAHRLRMPPLVGYLVAGVLVGPYTPGFVADQELAMELAEIGVILLMFGVGLHFSLKDLLSVRGIALPGAVAQMAVATLLGWGLASWLGWPMGGGLVFGLALSVASTVVLLTALQERRLVETERGKIAVGWLIVEDLAMVLALVLIPAVAGISPQDGTSAAHDPLIITIKRLLGVDFGIGGIVALTLLKVAAFVGVMLIVGRRVIPWALHVIAHTGSRELFRLGVLAIALGVAFGASKLFGVSLALGAFFAGMILSESELSHRAAQESLPLRDAFAVLFFVSAGMLFDPAIIVRDPLPVIATVLIITVGKSAAAFLIVLAFRRSTTTALTISASLAQIGEFSFILATLGVGMGLMPPEGRDLIVAGAILSIVLNPIAFFVAERWKVRIDRRAARSEETARVGAEAAGAAIPAEVGEPERPPVEDAAPPDDEDAPAASTLTDHTVLVGFGRVGRIVAAELLADGARFVVIEDSEARVGQARGAGIETIVGNAADPHVLELAAIPAARTLVVAIPNAFEAGQVASQARRANPRLMIVARAHGDAEAEHLAKLGADTIVRGEREIAMALANRLRDSLEFAMPEVARAEAAMAEGSANQLAADVTATLASGAPDTVASDAAATPSAGRSPSAAAPEPADGPALIPGLGDPRADNTADAGAPVEPGAAEPAVPGAATDQRR